VRRYENAMIPGCTAAWQEVGTISCSLEPSPLLIVPFFLCCGSFFWSETLSRKWAAIFLLCTEIHG